MTVAVGTVKLARSMEKYSGGQRIPSRPQARKILEAILQIQREFFGAQTVDTAPSYASAGQNAEEIVGEVLWGNTQADIMTKVGESFDTQRGYFFDFSPEALMRSVEESLVRLNQRTLNLVHVHAPHDDVPVAADTKMWKCLQDMQASTKIRHVGFSGYTQLAFEAAMDAGAKSIMVEYNAGNREHEALMQKAKARGVAVVVKKPLGYGQLVQKLGLKTAVKFFCDKEFIDMIVVGTQKPEHFREFCEILTG